MELFSRYDANPILEASGWPARSTRSSTRPRRGRRRDPAARPGRGPHRRLALGVARSADGLAGWTFEPERALLPDHDSEDERYGIEDPRITRLDEEYLILYTGYSPGGLCLPRHDERLPSYRRRGVVLPPAEQGRRPLPRPLRRPLRDAASARDDRARTADIWLSWSPDLEHWGDHRASRSASPATGTG